VPHAETAGDAEDDKNKRMSFKDSTEGETLLATDAQDDGSLGSSHQRE
jgi:hypothetical protein